MYIYMFSDVPANYSWEVPQGYDILPRSGRSSVKETCKFTATFSPMNARVYNSVAVCTLTDTMEQSDAVELRTDSCLFQKPMKLDGIGKNVHLSAEPCVMDDGCAADGDRMTIASEGKQKFESFSLDFGSVAMGCFFEKFVRVTNTSQVSIFSGHHSIWNCCYDVA